MLIQQIPLSLSLSPLLPLHHDKCQLALTHESLMHSNEWKSIKREERRLNMHIGNYV